MFHKYVGDIAHYITHLLYSQDTQSQKITIVNIYLNLPDVQKRNQFLTSCIEIPKSNIIYFKAF